MSPSFKRLINKYQEGGVRLYFFYDKLELCFINLPALHEQEKIGLFFDNFEALIQAEKKKLDLLVQFKKGHLSKIFA